MQSRVWCVRPWGAEDVWKCVYLFCSIEAYDKQDNKSQFKNHNRLKFDPNFLSSFMFFIIFFSVANQVWFLLSIERQLKTKCVGTKTNLYGSGRLCNLFQLGHDIDFSRFVSHFVFLLDMMKCFDCIPSSAYRMCTICKSWQSIVGK